MLSKSHSRSGRSCLALILPSQVDLFVLFLYVVSVIPKEGQICFPEQDSMSNKYAILWTVDNIIRLFLDLERGTLESSRYALLGLSLEKLR
jgi:hypothetical protein